MTGRPGRALGAGPWVLLPLAVLAHAALAALATAEFAATGWPLPTGLDTGAVMLVLATASAGLAGSAQVAVRAAVASRALRALIRSARQPVPPAVQEAAAALGCAAGLDVVADEDGFAVTYGLIRPRILVSVGLARTLTPGEITAVLAHEQEHQRRRDPLRLLAARLAAGWGWYLPAARWLAGHAALRRELAADRAAAGCAGRGVLAGALLKLASMPACPAVAAAGAARDGSRSLEARIAQLEAGRPPRQRLGVTRLLASGAALSVLAGACFCCAALSVILPGGVV
jgi:Zn-dependent protease with chaperone function